MIDIRIFSDRLFELANIKGKTNKELGKIIGVGASSVSHWMNGTRVIRLSYAVKVCDYFNCSLDFFAGRTETVIDFIPCAPPEFYTALRKVMEEKHLTRYRVMKETKKSAKHFDRWKAGSDPSLQTLIELADYFDVSIDYLVGRDR